jgi:hypothetical protein
LNAVVLFRAPVWWGVAVVALSFLIPSLVLLVVEQEVGFMMILAVPMVGVLGLVLSLVLGLIGRERAWTRTASHTAAITMTAVWSVAMVALREWDAWQLLPVVFVITWVFAMLAAMVGWNVGDMIRGALGKPGAADLYAPAVADALPMHERTTERYDWLAEADPYLADTVVEAVRGATAHGERLLAAVPAVQINRLWNLPIGVAVTDHHVVIVPVTMRGRPDGPPTALHAADLTAVAMRPGPSGDVVTVSASGGNSFRFALAFEERELAGSGGVDSVRSWLRDHSPRPAD